MFRLIKHLQRQREYDKNFGTALKLVEQGKKLEAFTLFKSMLPGHEFDPYLRRHIILLGEELNQPFELYMISCRN